MLSELGSAVRTNLKEEERYAFFGLVKQTNLLTNRNTLSIFDRKNCSSAKIMSPLSV